MKEEVSSSILFLLDGIFNHRGGDIYAFMRRNEFYIFVRICLSCFPHKSGADIDRSQIDLIAFADWYALTLFAYVISHSS